jgi:hypothetical protein
MKPRGHQLKKLVRSDVVRDAVMEALDEVMDRELPVKFWIGIPAMWGPKSDGWGGRPPKDPLTLYIVSNIGDDDGTPERLEDIVSLSDEVQDCLRARAGDDSFREGASIFAAGLRALADKIDAVATWLTVAEDQELAARRVCPPRG